MKTPVSSPVTFRTDGSAALVVGGGQGIGLATATALAAQGATVYIADRDPAVGRPAADAIGATFLDVDVLESESVDQAVSRVTSEQGGLDIAVNCAGVRHSAPAEEIDDEAWRRVFAVNTDGLFRCCRSEGSAMLAGRGGVIVNIASMSGIIVNRPQNQAAYNASKAAVTMLSKSLAVEWASRGIRVNSVSPGYVETAMTEQSRKDPERVSDWLARTPMARIAQPEEIAGAAMFLASPASSFVTGHDLVVDGGYTSI